MPQSPAGGAAAHRIECGCGFAIEGGEDEVVDAARRHADIAHGLELADPLVRALARPIGDPRARQPTTPHDHRPREKEKP